MSADRVSLESVVERLQAEGLLPAAKAEQAAALVARLRSAQPWYIRAMVGVGAWLASLLLIGFVASFSLAVGGTVGVGVVLVAAAVVLRRQSDNDFVVQSALAASLAGQGLVAFGVAQLVDGERVKVLSAVAIVASGVLFFTFPDRIHRVISVLIAASAAMVLVYAYELDALVPVAGPALAAALVLLHDNRVTLTARGMGNLARPLATGLMLAAFGCLLISTVYVLPELGVAFAFYPRPWISTLLLGALFLHVGRRILPALLAGSGRRALPLAYALMIVTIAAAWAAPGLLLALIVATLGAASGHGWLMGAGAAFLGVFVGAYFYGIEVTMLAKSTSLVGTGAAVLAARWLLLATLAAPAPAEGARPVDRSRQRGGRARLVVVGATAVVVLAVVNLQVAAKKRILDEGRTVLLRLAPVDPRSLMQGDYMALRYAMEDEVAAAAEADGLGDGAVVVALDDRDVARFVALDDGRGLAAHEQRLAFRRRGDTVRLASDAYFFQEGRGRAFAAARFGEVRVAADGTAILTGLRDEETRPLR